jgi:anaerobic magnesium-protoporphyrin IX monomethyl ester cyclase
MMKVTLVQPRYFNIWEALGLAYIGTYARKKFRGKLKVNFFQGYFDSDQTIIDASADADIVAFSCTSTVFKPALRLAEAIKAKKPEVRTIFGGFHPSAVPADCLGEPAVDQVVVGEGEEAFLQIINGDTSPIVYGKRTAVFADSFPDRDLIKNDRTIELCQKMTGKRITSFQSVRGCFFRCAFCAERIVSGVFDKKRNPLLERDPENLVSEIKWVAQKYALDYFKFVDPTWNTSNEKVFAVCEEMIRQKLDLPWEANIHASLANKKMLKMMKKAGCVQINVGCESGSQKILRDMRKGLVVEKIKQVFQWGRELEIERRGYFLIGMPNETIDDIHLTEKLVDEIRPDVFGVTILCPYPGTDFYNPDSMDDYDWTFADEYSNPYWETKHFSNTELKQQQKYLMEKFAATLTWHNKLIDE